MRRTATCLLIALLVVSGLGAGPVAAQSTPPPPATPDHLRAYSIVPPGQEGGVGHLEFISGDYGEHFSDQLEMYASLVDDDDVTEEELAEYFHPMRFGPAGEVERVYEPAEGVRVYRDDFGIPHIYAPDLAGAAFALGFASAEDRMFQMDAFRHAARGRLAEFIGPGDDDAIVRWDREIRREGYTDDELLSLYRSYDERFGEPGAAVQRGLQAYVDGINAYFDEVRSDPRKCDFAYVATSKPCPVALEDWSLLDTLHLVVLQLRVFGETAGGELQNAALFDHLTAKHGGGLGGEIYEDLLRRNDPRSPTSIAPEDGVFPSQDLGEVDWSSVAIPDRAGAQARRDARRRELRLGVLRSIGFPTGRASNALLVSADRSTTGNPLQIGAPQVGYAVPAFFMDIDVHAGEDHFRGPAVPGASALIPLGRGADYAWSLTTGYSDAVDTRVELLCDPKGGDAKQDSDHYLFEGECIPMEERTETIEVNPTALDPAAPRREEMVVQRTVHGPVSGRGTVDGEPVAFVKERFFWMKELDSVPQFYRWNTEVGSIDDFRAAARDFTMSFNSFYADAEHVGYFHVGHYPRRTEGVHPSLPTWGTGEWEWRGRIPFRRHPKVVDPAKGWVANWNNKPALGWDNYDGAKWGPVHRVGLLDREMEALFANGGKAELSDIVDVIREAATQDARAVYLGGRMVRALLPNDGSDVGLPPAAARVAEWVGAGAHRRNEDRNNQMDNGPALAMFDEWYDALVHRVFDDELGADAYGLVPAPVSDYDPAQGSVFWFDFSSYLDNLFDREARRSYARNYCDDITTHERESCTDQVRLAYEDAWKRLTAKQGQDWSRWSKPAENIVFEEQGAGSVDPIPWQNRGTHNHVVEVLSDAP